MKFHFIVIGLSVALFSNAYAESGTEEVNPNELNVEKYKQNYAHEHVTSLANRMATCQLSAIESYPQKYQDASVIPVANGVGLKQANDDLNSMIQTDIKNGDITDQELKTMTDAAIEKYKVCLSDSEPNPNNMPL